MTVGELKRILKDVPDTYWVTLFMENLDQQWNWHSDRKRPGLLGRIISMIDPLPKEFRLHLHSWAHKFSVTDWKVNGRGEFRITNGKELSGYIPMDKINGAEKGQVGEQQERKVSAEYVGPRQLPAGKGIVKR